MPNFQQHISCPTRGQNTLDHCYTQFNNAYKARSLPAMPPFSSHRNINKGSFRNPRWREVTHWSSHSEAMLQAALDDVDWDMFRASSSDVSEFTDVTLSFVNTLTEQATETVTIRTFSNQKPWWTEQSMMRLTIALPMPTYNASPLSGNMSKYKAVLCSLTCSKSRKTAIQGETHVAGTEDHLFL